MFDSLAGNTLQVVRRTHGRGNDMESRQEGQVLDLWKSLEETRSIGVDQKINVVELGIDTWNWKIMWKYELVG